MMKNNNNSSSHSHHRNPNDHHHHDQCLKHKLFMCEFCHKVFTTGQALGGHKTCHRSNKQQVDDHHHVNKGYKTMKITFSLSSSPSNHDNNVDAKKKRYSWTRVFKTTVHHPPTASTFKPNEQQELPAVDLLSLLPPRSYNTKKRSRRYLIQDEVANNTAPILPLLDISCESSVANLDLNLPEYKRMKLSTSSNGNDNEMMQKQRVFLTSDDIDERMVKSTESHHELGPRVVGDFDMAFKGTVHPHTVSTLESSQQESTAVDLLSFLPPRLYNTKKRSRRYLVHDGLTNNTAPIQLLDMSSESVASLDLNHCEYKRMKLSSTGNDSEMMHKHHVLPISDGIDETVLKEEKNLSVGETAVSRVVRNFDLNELPTNDVETELGLKVVGNFDLNELPTSDVGDEIKHSP